MRAGPPLRVAILEPPETSAISSFYHMYGIHADEKNPVRFDPQLADWMKEVADAAVEVSSRTKIPIEVRRFQLTPRYPLSKPRVRQELFTADVVATANVSPGMLGLIGAYVRNRFARCVVSYDTIADREQDETIINSYHLPVLDPSESSTTIRVQPHMHAILRNNRSELEKSFAYCFDPRSAPTAEVDPEKFFGIELVDRI